VHKVRQPAVAGQFYSDQASVLSQNVRALLGAARIKMGTATPNSMACSPKAIIVPHAGYIYSAAVAASAYVKVDPAIKRVILLGPVHRVPVQGLALPGVTSFSSPLGEIELDQVAIASIEHLPQVVESEAAHALEHSLEVQLPFLQTRLEDFKLLPLAVGDASAEAVAEVLNVLWGHSETLLVISSDLSHFHPYADAQRIDTETVQTILKAQATLTHEQACGATPINGLILAASRHHLHPHLLDLCNSGDTAGDKHRVVGYTAMAYTEEADYVG
jgi:AmmeMemoRadiSam system protein B